MNSMLRYLFLAAIVQRACAVCCAGFLTSLTPAGTMFEKFTAASSADLVCPNKYYNHPDCEEDTFAGMKGSSILVCESLWPARVCTRYDCSKPYGSVTVRNCNIANCNCISCTKFDSTMTEYCPPEGSTIVWGSFS